MKDKWMNIGFEEDELKPYNEPLPDLNDQIRIGKLALINEYRFYGIKKKEEDEHFILKFHLI